MCAPLDYGREAAMTSRFTSAILLFLLSVARRRTRTTVRLTVMSFLDVLGEEGTGEAIIRHLRLVSGMALLRGRGVR
ncbi:hypothetical protein LY78DRAFT_683230 [Colletotrichum sublineola]|nr:hypothetical protein LY78DRAFT_683230 [Colletotrichum sublineola]